MSNVYSTVIHILTKKTQEVGTEIERTLEEHLSEEGIDDEILAFLKKAQAKKDEMN